MGAEITNCLEEFMPDPSGRRTPYTRRQLHLIAEIQRVARMLGADRLSQREFDKHHRLASLGTVHYQFGSWNRAVRAAGLKTYGPGKSNVGRQINDATLLEEIVRLHRHIGKRPSDREMARFGRYSPKPYRDRWGSWVVARQSAYEMFGEPETDSR